MNGKCLAVECENYCSRTNCLKLGWLKAATPKINREGFCKYYKKNKLEKEVLSMPQSKDYFEKVFVYHPPTGNQPERYQKIRDKAKELAILINSNCPESREKSLAYTKIEESMFWANAAIARNENKI